ncbi:MAG: glycerophosphodiester phosphodiesterase family protein [Elusimicrobiota bacterium]
MKIAAHRGASGDRPENTLAAFRRALEQGCRAFECDVRQTKDGELVLSHDPDLKRTAGVNAEIGARTYAELARHDVGAWFGERFRGERLARFADLLKLLPPEVELHVDIKQAEPPYAGIEGRILRALRERGEWKTRTTFSSTDAATLERLAAAEDGLRLGYQPRLTPIDEAFSIAERLRPESLRLNLERLTPDWLTRARARDFLVYIYTVNTREDFARMRALNIDLVFSNYPAMVGAAEL